MVIFTFGVLLMLKGRLRSCSALPLLWALAPALPPSSG
jgi:hypothetical protein